MTFKEKLFILTRNPEALTSQLSGQELDPEFPLELGENISTDFIFPTKGATLPMEAFGQLALSGHPQIREGELLNLRPEKLVVGNGFGRGSSREHAPRALQQAGINEIICFGGSVERIFAENCYLLGIKVYESKAAPRTVAYLQEILETQQIFQVYQDKLRPDIAQAGGLSSYNKLRLTKSVEPLPIAHEEVAPNYPMTVAEKILARHTVNLRPNTHGERVVRPGDTGFTRVHFKMSYELHSDIVNNVLEKDFSGFSLADPHSVHLFQDHSALAVATNGGFVRLMEGQRAMAEKYGFTLHALDQERGYTDGICHTIAVEDTLVLPGQVAVGTDSHTCTLGVLNSLSWGIGANHMANVMVTNEALVEIPKTIKVNFSGKLTEGVAPKDVMLWLLSQDLVRSGASTGCIFEYDGSGLDRLTLDEQTVFTNMAVEGKAMTGVIARLTPALESHLKARRGWSRKEIENFFVQSDSNANYWQEVNIDLADMEPMVALPGDASYGIPLSLLEKTKVNNVYIGSCTGGNLSDLARAARALEGRKVASGVTLYIQAASRFILEQAGQAGILGVLEAAGAQVVGLGCGACIGLGPGRVSDEGVTVSATNRNIFGRMGGKAPVYLASPETAAKAAAAGFIGEKR